MLSLPVSEFFSTTFTYLSQSSFNNISQVKFVPFLIHDVDDDDDEDDDEMHIPFLMVVSVTQKHPTFKHDSSEKRVLHPSQLYRPYKFESFGGGWNDYEIQINIIINNSS
jgi:hypothetical protein